MNDLYLSVLASLDWHALSTHWILTLAHFLWQGAAIGLLTAAVLAVFRHASAHVRHGICLFALLSFLPCLVVTWMSVDVDKSARAVPETAAPAVAERERPAPRLPDFQPPVSLQPVSVSTEISQAPIPREDTSASANPISNPPVMDQSVVSRIAPLLAVGYFLGVLLLLSRTSIGLWGGRRLRTLSQQIHDTELISLIGQQAWRIGLKTAPVVAYCSRVAVPTVIGLLKPMVLLPASLVTHLQTDELAALLSHEFAHIRRHDLFVNLLQRLIESVLFFHPAVWWLSRRISFERENCCDDLASASGFGNLQYAGALLRMAELSLSQRSEKFASQLVALSAQGQNATHLTRRIERLLSIPSAPRLAVSRLSATFAVVLSVISVGVLAQIAEKQPVDQKPNTATNDDSVAVIEDQKISDNETLPASQSAEASTNETDDDRVEKPKAPPEGLKFLQPYPKLYSLSRDMTEVQFLTIVQREKLKIQKNPHLMLYSIPTGDGNIVNVSFVVFGINQFKCGGISLHQIRGEGPKAETPPAIVDSNGIYWSEYVTDGFRVGAKLLARGGELKSGEKLVLQYILMNETNGKKTVSLIPSSPVFPTLGTGNRVELSLFTGDTEARKFRIGPGQSLGVPSHRVEIDTTGFPLGDYHVIARNFFWRPDPENPNHQDGFPARMEIPLTIVSNEPGSGNPPLIAEDSADGIDWGGPVAGMQVGSRFVADSTLFEPGSSPKVQLFVRNVTRNPIEVRVFLPHPMDGWLMNVENRQGDNILLERTPIDIAAPEQILKLKIPAGETLPLTGMKQNVNDGVAEIKNSSFRIERVKPNNDFWPGGILVSKGGEYRAIHTVMMKRPDIPGVRLDVESGQSEFRVSGPELKPSGAKTNQKSSENGEAAIRLWKTRLVDGVTGKPLPGITVRVLGAITSKSEPQAIELVSSGQGIITVPLRDGTVTPVDAQTSGWWSGPYQFIGQPPSNPNQPPQQDGEPVSDPKVPRDIKLWRGDTVTGKLLYPDKSPAGGVLLNVGVDINHIEWMKRLGMELTLRYSFDHGQWPDWSRAIITNDDGSFTTTVPPAAARSWVRVGTAGRAFAFINPEHIETESTRKALAECIPFEAELAGNNPGYGYRIVDRIVQPGPRDDLLNFGTLQLIAGIRVRGRVIDADGNGLAGIRLTTTDAHRPHSRGSTWSDDDGRFEFLPIEEGPSVIKVDARLRDAFGKVISQDVRAVFIDQQYLVVSEAVEVIVKAVPHVDLEFEWKDRRAEQADRVSYYGHFKGHFKVVGQYPLDDEERVYWNGETTLIERDGRKFQVVKVPRKLMNPTLVLPRDRVVTASYEDETGKTSGPGRVELGDITKPIHRTIYGDEPQKPE